MNKILGTVLIFLGLATVVIADDLADANNPLAGVTAINTHNYTMTDLSGTDDTMNQAIGRIAQPFFNGRMLVRATVPLNSYNSSTPDADRTGLGNANIFATYSFISSPKAVVGAGPFMLFPATNNMGTDSWQLGAAFVAFFLPSPIFQGGGLVTWQMNVGGPEDTHVATAQPILFFQLGGGTYLRSSGIMTFDFEKNMYNIPLGFGMGHVFRGGSEKVIYNAFVEPQFSVYNKGNGLPETQIFFGFNIQLKNG